MTASLQSWLATFDEITAMADSLVNLSPEQAVERFNDYLMYSYRIGHSDASEQLGLTDSVEEILEMDAVMYSYPGENSIQDKMKDYVGKSDMAAVQRLLSSELHRTFATGSLDSAYRVPSATKTWCTMEDNKVRDTHDYLQGINAPVDGLFFTYDGDSAFAPGLFANPANNANCRCWLEYSR